MSTIDVKKFTRELKKVANRTAQNVCDKYDYRNRDVYSEAVDTTFKVINEFAAKHRVKVREVDAHRLATKAATHAFNVPPIQRKPKQKQVDIPVIDTKPKKLKRKESDKVRKRLFILDVILAVVVLLAVFGFASDYYGDQNADRIEAERADEIMKIEKAKLDAYVCMSKTFFHTLPAYMTRDFRVVKVKKYGDGYVIRFKNLDYDIYFDIVVEGNGKAYPVQ